MIDLNSLPDMECGIIMIYGSLDYSNKFSVAVIERESCLCIHEPESKWCPQLDMAQASNVA